MQQQLGNSKLNEDTDDKQRLEEIQNFKNQFPLVSISQFRITT
jgi:hypothetical protein